MQNEGDCRQTQHRFVQLSHVKNNCADLEVNSRFCAIQNIQIADLLFCSGKKEHKPGILCPFLDERQTEVIHELPAELELKIATNFSCSIYNLNYCYTN
jgi:hypothetical protein